MAEYSREQRNQLSRAVANSETKSRQFNDFIDNRLQSTLKKDGLNHSIQRVVRSDNTWLTSAQKETFDQACECFTRMLINSCSWVNDPNIEVVIVGDRSTGDCGVTRFYINKGEGYIQLWNNFLSNIPNSASFKIEITIDMSKNNTATELYTTMLHEWYVHASHYYDDYIHEVRDYEGGIVSLNMDEATAEREHLNYSQLDDATLEMWTQSLQLSPRLQNRVLANLKKDRDQYYQY